MLYMVTFTINIPPMLAYIPYMDPMGMILWNFRIWKTFVNMKIRIDKICRFQASMISIDDLFQCCWGRDFRVLITRLPCVIMIPIDQSANVHPLVSLNYHPSSDYCCQVLTFAVDLCHPTECKVDPPRVAAGTKDMANCWGCFRMTKQIETFINQREVLIFFLARR